MCACKRQSERPITALEFYYFCRRSTGIQLTFSNLQTSCMILGSPMTSRALRVHPFDDRRSIDRRPDVAERRTTPPASNGSIHCTATTQEVRSGSREVRYHLQAAKVTAGWLPERSVGLVIAQGDMLTTGCHLITGRYRASLRAIHRTS